MTQTSDVVRVALYNPDPTRRCSDPVFGTIEFSDEGWVKLHSMATGYIAACGTKSDSLRPLRNRVQTAARELASQTVGMVASDLCTFNRQPTLIHPNLLPIVLRPYERVSKVAIGPARPSASGAPGDAATVERSDGREATVEGRPASERGDSPERDVNARVLERVPEWARAVEERAKIKEAARSARAAQARDVAKLDEAGGKTESTTLVRPGSERDDRSDAVRRATDACARRPEIHAGPAQFFPPLDPPCADDAARIDRARVDDERGQERFAIDSIACRDTFEGFLVTRRGMGSALASAEEMRRPVYDIHGTSTRKFVEDMVAWARQNSRPLAWSSGDEGSASSSASHHEGSESRDTEGDESAPSSSQSEVE